MDAWMKLAHDAIISIAKYCCLWVPDNYHDCKKFVGGARGVMVIIIGIARGVMVIVVGIGHDDTSSNPGRDWLRFT